MKRENIKSGRQLFAFLLIFIMGISISYPAYAKSSSTKISLSLSGKYAIIMDVDTGKVLYSKNAKTKCENASTTKLMTAIVAVEKNKSLKKKIRISANASSTIAVKLGMNQGDSYYFRDLLYAMLLPSANDCAVAVAEGTCGSVSSFMNKVNKKAKKIGCTSTHFGTPNGLTSSKTHYTTAYDLAFIMKYAYNNDTIRSILKKKQYSFKSINGKYHSVTNTNQLLNSKKYYCVGKTGNGRLAKYCYTGVYTYKGHSYVIVTLGNATDGGKWNDAKKMISACRQNAKEVAKNLSLNHSLAELEIGATVKLKVTGTKSDIKWSSKNKAIADVDKNGKVMGKRKGKTTIFARIYGRTLKCKVKVTESELGYEVESNKEKV